MPVLKQISPVVVPMAPNACPCAMVPSAKRSTAGIALSGMVKMGFWLNKLRKNKQEAPIFRESFTQREVGSPEPVPRADSPEPRVKINLQFTTHDSRLTIHHCPLPYPYCP